MSHKLVTVCCILLLMATMAHVHTQDALWKQRKRDDLRSNNIKFSVNHLDYSQFIPNVPDFTQIQKTLTVDEKEGMAYAVFFNSSTLHLLKVNLTNGIYSVRNLANGISDQTNAEVYVAAGAVLDEYALTVLLGTSNSSYMLKISIQDNNRFSSVNLDEYGKPYAISYSSNPATIIVVGSKLIGSFQKSVNYEIWNVEIRNSTSNNKLRHLIPW